MLVRQRLVDAVDDHVLLKVILGSWWSYERRRHAMMLMPLQPKAIDGVMQREGDPQPVLRGVVPTGNMGERG